MAPHVVRAQIPGYKHISLTSFWFVCTHCVTNLLLVCENKIQTKQNSNNNKIRETGNTYASISNTDRQTNKQTTKPFLNLQACSFLPVRAKCTPMVIVVTLRYVSVSLSRSRFFNLASWSPCTSAPSPAGLCSWSPRRSWGGSRSPASGRSGWRRAGSWWAVSGDACRAWASRRIAPGVQHGVKGRGSRSRCAPPHCGHRNETNNNNKNILYSSQREIKAVVQHQH